MMLLLPMVRFSAVALFWVLLRFSVEAKIGPGVRESVANDQAEANISGNVSKGTMIVVMLVRLQGGADVAGDTCPMQTQIKTMQDDVLGAMNSGFESIYEYSCVPAMAGIIYTMDAIAALEKNEHVRQVDVDVEETEDDLDVGEFEPAFEGKRKLLANSVPFVGANMRHQQGNKGNGVVVAVLSTGVDTDHPNLAGRIKAQACFGSFCPNGPSDGEDLGGGQGTHTAGIIASNGTLGGVGMAPEVDIVAVRVGDGLMPIISGLDYIMNNTDLGVKIINIWPFGRFINYPGNCDSVDSCTMAIADAVTSLREQGVITFAGSGRDPSSTGMNVPACISNVVAVGASDLDDNPAFATNSNSETNIFAPGVEIISSQNDIGLIATRSGTYAASAHAAGCAALLVESGEATTPQAIENRLESSAFKVTSKGLVFPRMDCSPAPPIVTGDPHFRTWHGKTFSYHGECDLVLISSPMFSSGLGLDLHIRTKRRHWWSFVQNAALRIGPDVLEVASDTTHFLNGVLDAELPSKIGGYEVSKIVVDSPFSIVYIVNLGEGQTIKISRGKRRMLSVDVSQHQKTFHDSVGLMGTWKKKGLIARDGVTDLLNDSNAFGREWQVLDSENQLFHALRYPQHPEICIEGSNENRRLEEMPERIPMALVEKACSHVEDANKDFCIYDVMAMGDLSVAESPFYTKDLNQY